MSKASENKKLINEFKNLNSSILTQMLDNSPEIYLAFANVLNQVEKKFIGSSIEDSTEHELANYRVKTEEEFKQQFGDNWRDKTPWTKGTSMDWLFGKRITEVVDQDNYDAIYDKINDKEHFGTSKEKDKDKQIYYLYPIMWIYDPASSKTDDSKKHVLENYRIKTKEEFEKYYGGPENVPGWALAGGMDWMFGKKLTELIDDSEYDAVYKKVKDLKSFYSDSEKDPEANWWTIEPEMWIWNPTSSKTDDTKKKWTLEDFKNVKIKVDTPEKSAKFQQFVIDLGVKWSKIDVGDVSKRLSVNHTNKKHLIIRYEDPSLGKEYRIYFISDKVDFESIADKEIFYDDIFGKETTTEKQIDTQESGKYKLPIDTVPYELNNYYSFFTKNTGDRNSPTQSAGDLRQFTKNSINEREIRRELLTTYFRGNDNMWYSVFITDDGVWKWKKLSALSQKAAEADFIKQKEEAEKSKTSTSESTTKDENPGLKKEFYRDTKIRVKNPNQSANLQRFFNKLGITWKTGGVVNYADANFLFVGKNLNLVYSLDEKDFEDSIKEELSYKSILPLIKQTVLDVKMK